MDIKYQGTDSQFRTSKKLNLVTTHWVLVLITLPDDNDDDDVNGYIYLLHVDSLQIVTYNHYHKVLMNFSSHLIRLKYLSF